VLYLALDKKSTIGWDSVEAMFAAFLEGESSYYVGRSIKGGFWRYWGTKKAAVGKKGASGYQKQTVVGIMQARVDKKVVEHKSVVLWRANPTETVTAFDQIRLEMFFGSMVFKLVRAQRKPPGTDRVLYVAFSRNLASIEDFYRRGDENKMGESRMDLSGQTHNQTTATRAPRVCGLRVLTPSGTRGHVVSTWPPGPIGSPATCS
jgi:hypothetical protein